MIAIPNTYTVLEYIKYPADYVSEPLRLSANLVSYYCHLPCGGALGGLAEGFARGAGSFVFSVAGPVDRTGLVGCGVCSLTVRTGLVRCDTPRGGGVKQLRCLVSYGIIIIIITTIKISFDM